MGIWGWGFRGLGVNGFWGLGSRDQESGRGVGGVFPGFEFRHSS